MTARPSIVLPRRRLLRAATGLLAAGAAIPAPAADARAGDDGPAAWPAVKLLDGSTLEPSAWRDTAGVLVLWSTDCPFCRRHNPHVEKLHRAVAGRRMRVLGAALDRDADKVRRHVAEHGLTFPMTLDAEALRARFGLKKVIPTTVMFDRRGRLLERIPGEMFEEDVLALAKLADGPA